MDKDDKQDNNDNDNIINNIFTAEYNPSERFIKDNEEICFKCGQINKIIHLQVCHTLCSNCGQVMDCSDKGYIW